MSAEPAPQLSRVTPFRPPSSPEPPRGASPADVRLAQGLLPRAVLKGCREAIQRMPEPDPRSYGVTSTVRGEGRSTVAAGMALLQWLDYERRTVLVDLDLEQPSLHRRFGLAEGSGLSDLIEGHGAVEDHLQRVVGDLYVLTAGRLREDAPRTLTRLAQSSVISQLFEWAEAVVFDLPPVLGSPTGLEAARLSGSPVMVVRAGVTPLPRAKEALDALPACSSVILNGVESAMPPWLRRATGSWKP
ncbi:MAG TPA: CpsD/CapB family tyrosine-protein kinase [Candidatus Binatia bacterium]|nr:CpsD/CapB family tyrosine-protein kinase [Candidatus Binatia bacterium]